MGKPLSNPKASPEAVRLYEYLCSVEGRGILAGQQENPDARCHGGDMRYIKAVTGKLPAIRGLDYIHNDFEGVTRRAKDWWKKGGIVSICWHWGTPPDGVGYQSSLSQIDLEEALTEGTDLHAGMLRQMDEAAMALQKLCRAGVPVLWRPFHEFDGAWFWWGKGGSDAFIRLWRLMYDRFTNRFGLNNLIWVLGYCGDVHEGWYPGDAYVDIVGADTYYEDRQIPMYHRVRDLFGDRFPLCYHENGPLPDPQELAEKGIGWIWFLTWHNWHIRKQNSRERVRAVYGHPYVITLDKLPAWR